jgi:exodeoxyribonuclease V alpha subunit
MTLGFEIDPENSIEGVVERITFQNPDTGFTVARFSPTKGRGLITVTGNMFSVHPGEYLALKGGWENHPRHGRQFKVESYRPHIPSTVEGIERFLASGYVHGIGTIYAKRLVKHFGAELFDVIENNPKRLREVDGMGKVRCTAIIDGYKRHREIREIIIFLQSHNIPTSLAHKVYREYGDASLSVLREDPYRLADDIFGVGFQTADNIARKLGLPDDSPKRVRAAVKYSLRRAADDGHTFLPADEALRAVCELTGTDEPAGFAAIDYLMKEGDITKEDDQRLFLKPFHIGETYVAKRFAEMARGQVRDYNADRLERVISEIENRENLHLNTEQRKAITACFTRQLVVITGGPGTGKSTALRVLCRLFERLQKAVVLASPTGRAAKRLSEACSRDAYTIHRLLEYKPRAGGFLRNEKRPLTGDVFVIDEASMLDNMLCYHFLRALPKGSRLVLVGDVDQLPSVGAGNILKDVINSGVVHTVRLKEIFRQAEHSAIIVNAHRINNGRMPIFEGEAIRKDFRFIRSEEPAEIAQHIIGIASKKLRRKFDPVRDIQVLCPMHNGEAGVRNLNQELQYALNPPRDGEELIVGGRLFRPGDRVMQIRNNYDKDVFNGDIGYIDSIHLGEGELIAQFDKKVHYKLSELDELQHAYAITVHKSQGSEYPVVLLPLTTQHFVMLQRNLLYTAVTRAKTLCILVGSPRALGIALRNDRLAHRYTYLKERLQKVKE